MCRPAPACKAALDEASRRWPNRRTTSDGICASPQHTAVNPSSDHEPNWDGYATAFDLSHDPANGCDCHVLSRMILSDGRWDYIIFDNRIISRRRVEEGWRDYDGTNPHDNHMHVSVLDRFQYDTSPWFEESDEMPLNQADKDWIKGTIEGAVIKGIASIVDDFKRLDDKVEATADKVDDLRDDRNVTMPYLENAGFPGVNEREAIAKTFLGVQEIRGKV